jgi:hypothetical protein
MGDAFRIQRHLQYHGGVMAGALPPEGIVRNLVVDRSGSDSSHLVEQEPYSMEVVAQAQEFLRDVHYAVENKEEASKDWPRTLCRSYCPFYSACRRPEIGREYIGDPDQQVLVDAYGEAKALVKEAKQLQDELRPLLEGFEGATDSHEIHWTTKNTRNGPVKSLFVDRLKEAS